MTICEAHVDVGMFHDSGTIAQGNLNKQQLFRNTLVSRKYCHIEATALCVTKFEQTAIFCD
jgi:hypothetical protein